MFRLAICQRENGGEPDGLTRDSEGYLWSAQWGGGMHHSLSIGRRRRTADSTTCDVGHEPNIWRAKLLGDLCDCRKELRSFRSGAGLRRGVPAINWNLWCGGVSLANSNLMSGQSG